MDIKELTLQRDDAELGFKNARIALAVIVEFSALNIVNLLVNGGSLFAFSASIPYLAVGYGVLFESAWSLALGIITACLVLGAYLVCFFKSKKDWRFVIAGSGLFAVDVGVLFYKHFAHGYSGIVDVVIHLFGLFLLLMGVYGGYRLKTLPEIPVQEVEINEEVGESAPLSPLTYKRARTIVKARSKEYDICYRRVKKIYELVVDGEVYAREDFQLDSHSVSARLNGDTICAGYDGSTRFYIEVNGERVKEKIRFW